MSAPTNIAEPPTVELIRAPIHPNIIIPVGWDFGAVLLSAVTERGGTYHDPFLRFYDRAVQQWVQGVTSMNGKVVPAIMASPLLAHATYKELLGKRNLVHPDAESVDAKFPLPYISIERTSIDPNPAHANCNYPMRKQARIDADLQRRTGYSRYPKPLLLSYQIDVWARYQSHMNWMVRGIEQQFWDQIAYWGVQVQHLPTLLMPIRRGGFVNNSDLETDKERLLRWTLTVKVESWMFFDLLKAPTSMILVTDTGVAGDMRRTSTRVHPLAPTMSSDEINNLPGQPAQNVAALALGVSLSEDSDWDEMQDGSVALDQEAP